MILIKSNWERIVDLYDVSRIIKEYYNPELADEMNKLIDKFEDELVVANNEISYLESTLWVDVEEIEYLEEKIKKYNKLISRLDNDISELKKISI